MHHAPPAAPDASGGATPPARLLDLTRLLSRVGRGPLTGVDRVEFAYLTDLLAQPVPVFALLRASPVDVLLDRAGMETFVRLISGGEPWGPADLLSRLVRRQSALQRRARATMRRLAIAKSLGPGLGLMLRRHLPAGTVYLNTGHSNLRPRVLRAVRQVPAARISVLLHDTIPVDHPEFSRSGIPERFAGILRLVARHADRVIFNSEQSRRDARRHFAAAGRIPPDVVAHLGIDPPLPDPARLPDLPLDRPYFVTIGTIEPRKNHTLLLDLWEDFGRTLPEEDIPRLFILGSRGWNNSAVFDRLDHSPMMGRTVFEVSGLVDGALFALLQGARGLLFPSHAEGFGLPVLEAAALSVPVICNDLPIYREFAGEYPIYAAVDDKYLWAQQIGELARNCPRRVPGADTAMRQDWINHFNIVLKIT